MVPHGPPMAPPWAPHGTPWAPHGPHMVPHVTPMGTHGPPWVHSRFCSKVDATFRANVLQVICLPLKSSLPELVSGSQRQLPEMGLGPWLGTHPSTRARDQDDLSSEQTHSNIYTVAVLVQVLELSQTFASRFSGHARCGFAGCLCNVFREPHVKQYKYCVCMNVY